MFSQNKNSYLQSIYSEINPRLLNRSVDLARKQKGDVHDASPAANRLCSQQPIAPLLHEYDPTRRYLSYGRDDVTNLKKDLKSHDEELLLRTLSTLNDVLRNPEKAYEAIKLNIIKELLSVITREDAFVRQRCCLSLEVLSEYSFGRRALTGNPKILDMLLKLTKDNELLVRLRAAKCLERLSSSQDIADVLVNCGYIQAIIDLLGKDEDEVTNEHLTTLSHLMYGNGKYIAMEYGGFPLLVHMIDVEEVREEVLRCLVMMTITSLGQHLAIKFDLLEKLEKLILRESDDFKISATSVLMFCTIQQTAKVRVFQMKRLVSRLVQLSKNHMNTQLQLNCIEILRNLSEYQKIRKMLREKHLARIQKIQAATEPVAKAKEKLITSIKWRPGEDDLIRECKKYHYELESLLE